MPSVIFAYNSSTSIPAAGAQRVTYSIGYANGNLSKVVGQRHILIDDAEARDVAGKRLILKFIIGRALLKTPATRAWFVSFFEAKHRWAVYGNFKDTANSANDNLCKCNPPEDEVEVSVSRDMETYELISEKVF